MTISNLFGPSWLPLWLIALVGLVLELRARRAERLQTHAPTRQPDDTQRDYGDETDPHPRRRLASPAPRTGWLREVDPCWCCGRPAVIGQLWCFDCAFHIDAAKLDIGDRTYYAQYGMICPFTDLDEPNLEETDPNGGDIAMEGLGVPTRLHVRDGDLVSLGELHPRDQLVFGHARRLR